MFLRSGRTALMSALFVLSLSSVHGQEGTPSGRNPGGDQTENRLAQVLRGLDRAHYLGEVEVSPDGKRLAWIQGSRGGTEIRVAPVDDVSKFIRITAAANADQHCREGEFNWAPDSSHLVFLSDCATSDEQIYLAGASGSPVRRISQLRGDVGAPVFSPDGKAIAFLYVEGTTRPVGALAAQDLPSGVIGEGQSDIQRVAFVPADAAQPLEPKFITPPNLHVYEFDWAPDSQSLAYIAADPPGENNWWVARLYSQQAGGEPKIVLDPQHVPGELHGMQMAVPRWSPDGKAIAFIGGLMSDQGVTGGDIWIVPAVGGKPLNLTPQRPSSPAWITWGGTHRLYASELAGGDSRLIRLDLAGSLNSPDLTVSSTATVFSLPDSIGDNRMEKSLSSTADRSVFVFRASGYSAPPEIFAARTVAPAGGSGSVFPPIEQISHINEGVQPAWGRAASLNWTNEGFHVQGWLLFPKDYDASKKYPLIVEVHGGPASAVVSSWGAGWGLSPAAFSALGYFVLQPNPRGSYGQGEAFTKANRKDFGYGDLRDILAGVDAVLAKYPVDPDRVGLTGWSYGGFMTMFAVTQTHRFRAAVAGAGISDWLSYYGENSIDQWMIPYFGASVYDDPGVYAKSSAINFIKEVKTPTLVVVGDRDGECPAPQSFEFWHALRDLHVSTELVVYPNEGHDFADPAHRRDVMERAVDWFAKHMPSEQ